MPEFTPPVDPAEAAGFQAVTAAGQLLYRLYRLSPSPMSVRIVSGIASPYPGEHHLSPEKILAADIGSGLGGRAVFTGGRTWTVSTAEAISLVAAGYSVPIAGLVLAAPITFGLTFHNATLDVAPNVTVILVGQVPFTLTVLTPAVANTQRIQPSYIASDFTLFAPSLVSTSNFYAGDYSQNY